MIKLVKGCFIPNAGRVSEQYDIGPAYFTANVSAEKIDAVFRHFIRTQKDQMFFVLELPTNGKQEERLRTEDQSPFHVDVYYIDGLEEICALQLLDAYGELLINDGMNRFGFGCFENSDELILDKYNVMQLWTQNIDAYIGFFEAHGIPRVEKCVTAWRSFTSERPGACMMVEQDGLSVYDLPDRLKDWGIYFAERRLDD